MRTLLSTVSTVGISLFCFGVLSGCEGGESEKPAPTASQPPASSGPSTPPPSTNPHAGNPHGAKPAGRPPMKKPELGIQWDVPSEFKEVPTRSMMRHATYSVEGKDGAAEIAVFYFGPGQGGEIEANISRWVSQFKDAAADDVIRDAREANGLKQSIVSVKSGTFASGMPGGPQGPQTAWGLEGAIIEAPSGRYFFKMTGPATTVESSRKAFAKLLESAKLKE